MTTLLVYDELLGRERALCIDCLDAWASNGLDTPDASDAKPSELPCDNCLEVERLVQEAEEA